MTAPIFAFQSGRLAAGKGFSAPIAIITEAVRLDHVAIVFADDLLIHTDDPLVVDLVVRRKIICAGAEEVRTGLLARFEFGAFTVNSLKAGDAFEAGEVHRCPQTLIPELELGDVVSVTVKSKRPVPAFHLAAHAPEDVSAQAAFAYISALRERGQLPAYAGPSQAQVTSALQGALNGGGR